MSVSMLVPGSLCSLGERRSRQRALLLPLPPPPPYSYHDQASPQEQPRAGRIVAPSTAQPSSTSEQHRSVQACTLALDAVKKGNAANIFPVCVAAKKTKVDGLCEICGVCASQVGCLGES